MKHVIAFLLCLSLAFLPAPATVIVVGQPAAAGADPFTNVPFFWGMEGATWSNAEKGGSTTGTVSGAANETSVVQVGTDSEAISGGIVSFSPTGNVNHLVGKIGYWHRAATSITHFKAHLVVRFDDSNRFFIHDNGDGGLRWYYQSGGSGFDRNTSAGRSANTWYWIEFSWDKAGNSYSLVVQNEAGTTVISDTATDSTGTWAGAPTEFKIGDWIGAGGTAYIDSFMVADNAAEDLWALRTSSP